MKMLILQLFKFAPAKKGSNTLILILKKKSNVSEQGF